MAVNSREHFIVVVISGNSATLDNYCNLFFFFLFFSFSFFYVVDCVISYVVI